MNSTYGIIDPRNSEIKYIGCTSDPKARLYGHIASHKGKTKVAQWVKELKQQGLKPEMVVLEYGLNHDKGRESESFWAEYFRALGANLLNTKTPGDRGISLVGAPSAWYWHYGSRDSFHIYNKFLANSQPF